MSVMKKMFLYNLYARSFLIVFLFLIAFTVQTANKKVPVKKAPVAPAHQLPSLQDAIKALVKEQANQAAGIVAGVPVQKPVVPPQRMDKYTQTEALMSLPFIQDLIKKNYPDYQKYSKIIDACKAKEKQLKGSYYAFYHAYDNQWRVPQDLYKQLYAYYHPLTADIPDTFTFLRFVEQSAPSAQTFLVEEIKKYGLINDNDPHRMLLLSTNLALFGSVGYKDECTWAYFMQASSHKDVSREIYERILDTYGLTYQYISEFTKLEKLLEKASKEQTLLQLFVPINRVDEVAYLAWVRGIPAHEKTIELVLKDIPKKLKQDFDYVKVALNKLGEIYQAQQEKHPIFKDLMESVSKGDFSVDAFLKIYCNTPAKLAEINDFSARLLLSKENILQAFSDVQMYQYVTTPPAVLKEYHTKLNEIVRNIIEEKKQRQVTPKPVVSPLDKAELEKKFADVGAVFAQVSKDRQDLQTLRNTYMKEYAQKGMSGNCMQLVGKVTQATMTYVNQRIAETIKKVGPAPTKFSVFTMGSMARDESGFFTDLEIGILVAKKDPAILTYLRKFSQELADRFFQLGEHPDVGGKGLRIDEEDNAPDHLRWYARYASPEQIALLAKVFGPDTSKSPQEGSRVFVATPQEFARYLEPNAVKNLVGATGREQEIVRGISAVVRNMRHLYGDKALFDQYMKERDTYLKGQPQIKNVHYANRREEIAYRGLESDVEKHSKASSPISVGKLGDKVDPKRSLYRFPEQVLTNLGFWYNVGVQNTVQIADKLVALKHMSLEWGNALKDLMNFTMCLRLRKQMTLGKQGFAVPVTQKGYNELRQKFANDLAEANKDLASAKVKKDAKLIAQAEDKVLHAQVDIADLNKMIPGQADSIISPEIITLLNTKYLPLEKKLLEVVRKFLAGDKNAFLQKM